MSELRTNRIVPRDGLPSGSAGGIIQIKQTVVTVDTFTTSSQNTAVDITGLNVTITPTRSDSKILVSGTINHNVDTACACIWILLRGSTEIPTNSEPDISGICAATFNANRANTISFEYLDSPATTSATTYKVQVYLRDSTTYQLNRRVNTYNAASTLTAKEVSG